jgi:hypothetical protein
MSFLFLFLERTILCMLFCILLYMIYLTFYDIFCSVFGDFFQIKIALKKLKLKKPTVRVDLFVFGLETQKKLAPNE